MTDVKRNREGADELGNVWAGGAIDCRVRVHHDVRQMHPRHLLHEVQEVVSGCWSLARKEDQGERGGAPDSEPARRTP